VVIEAAEIERSTVADGAQDNHVGDRVESSAVGRNPRIFRDFGLPQAMRLDVGDGVQVAVS
jgi:hypothetical protein